MSALSFSRKGLLRYTCFRAESHSLNQARHDRGEVAGAAPLAAARYGPR